jgi:hypothetical protein
MQYIDVKWSFDIIIRNFAITVKKSQAYKAFYVKSLWNLKRCGIFKYEKYFTVYYIYIILV